MLLCCPVQADNEALHTRVRDLQDELSSKEMQLRWKLNTNELQLKEQIVYNVRRFRWPQTCAMSADQICAAMTVGTACTATPGDRDIVSTCT
jgi:hypothetical protein